MVLKQFGCCCPAQDFMQVIVRPWHGFADSFMLDMVTSADWGMGTGPSNVGQSASTVEGLSVKML